MDLTLDVGSVFAGRYRVVRPIARGGMGAVYEVVHLETERRRAMKVILPTALKSDEARDRFKREAKVGAIIDSEFVVDVFDAGIDPATQMPFMVMELLKGEELGVRIERAGPLTAQEVVTYLHQTALALDKSHRASVIHRDIKPENLFLTEREDGPPRIKVLDFGIAKLLADGGLTVNATRSIGTPRYMAPEQFHGGVVVSAATDVYALVHVAYTLLVGVAYYEDEANTESGILGFAMAVSRGPQEPATARAARRRVALPPAFDAWFFRGTAVNPAHRFAVATDAIAHLADALGVPRSAGGSIGASNAGPPRAPLPSGAMPARTELSDGPYFAAAGTQPVRPPPRHGPAVAAALGALALAIVGAGLYVLASGRGGSGSPATQPPAEPSMPAIAGSAPRAVEQPPEAVTASVVGPPPSTASAPASAGASVITPVPSASSERRRHGATALPRPQPLAPAVATQAPGPASPPAPAPYSRD